MKSASQSLGCTCGSKRDLNSNKKGVASGERFDMTIIMSSFSTVSQRMSRPQAAAVCAPGVGDTTINKVNALGRLPGRGNRRCPSEGCLPSCHRRNDDRQLVGSVSVKMETAVKKMTEIRN